MERKSKQRNKTRRMEKVFRKIIRGQRSKGINGQKERRDRRKTRRRKF